MRKMIQMLAVLLLSVAIFGCSKQQPETKVLSSAELKAMVVQLPVISAANFEVDVLLDLSKTSEEISDFLPQRKLNISAVGAYDLEHKYEQRVNLKAEIESLGHVDLTVPMVIDFKQLEFLINPTEVLANSPVPLGPEFDKYMNKYIRIDLSEILDLVAAEIDFDLDKVSFEKVGKAFMRATVSAMASLDDKLFVAQELNATAKAVGASRQIGLTLDSANYHNYLKLFYTELGKEIKQPELGLPTEVSDLVDEFMLLLDEELAKNEDSGEFVFYFDQKEQLLATGVKYEQSQKQFGTIVIDIITKHSNIGNPQYKIKPAANKIIDLDLPY